MKIGPATIALLIFSSRAVFGVSPLTTDDADTVESGRLQLNAGWQFSRIGSATLHGIPVNPVLGLSSRGEFGVTFGYQWRDASGTTAGKTPADGITDLLLETKWRLWQTADDLFKGSARFDLKLPLASESQNLSTGDIDAGGVLVATRCWVPTCLDWNIGYAVIDASHAVFGDDQWFLGQAVRQQLNGDWTLIGEINGVVPNGKAADSANLHFNGGTQFSVRENFLLSALVGSAAGSKSPDLTGYLGFTYVF